MARPLLPAAFLLACFPLCHAGLAFQTPFTGAPVGVTVRAKPHLVAEGPGVLKVDSSLVLIPVHVTDPFGSSITTLPKGGFRLFEDNMEESIVHFSKDDAPVSVGLLVDCSGSMRNKMAKVLEATAALFNTANPEDEFFLVKFSERAKLEIPFTANSDEIYQQVAKISPSGETSLLDAIHIGMGEMKRAHNWRKALVILSDGGDNRSRQTVKRVKGDLIEADVQVYAMGIFDTNLAVKHTKEERLGPLLLDELAAQTGGQHFPVKDLDELPSIAMRIGRELRTQYLLGYYSSNGVRDGKYRRVRVTLAPPESAPPLHAAYRQGYYAPSK